MGQHANAPTLGQSFPSFMTEFVAESDRAAVILGSAQIELLLGQVLDKFLLPASSSTDELLEGEGPLSAFSAKIKAAHRLGLIDDHFCKQLHTFRRLRNVFAHEVAGGSLSTGSAKDRTLAMAEPLLATRYFQSLQNRVAQIMRREPADAAVVFRATLAVFHVHLAWLHARLAPIARQTHISVLEMCKQAPTPEDYLAATESRKDA